MLESRRASRLSKIDESILRSLNASVNANAAQCNDTQDIRDINDILGPLPKVPDSSTNWSRRASATSEIYEEIGDGELLQRYVKLLKAFPLIHFNIRNTIDYKDHMSVH